MPEGDTIFRAAAALHRALAGQVIVRFDTAFAHLARVHDDTPVTGRVVETCESVGKHLLIWFSGDLILRTHMRMSGSWHLYRPGEAWQRPARDMRVRLDSDAWVAVAFTVPVAEFLRSRDLPRNRALAPLGPDLLSPTLDRDEARRRLAAAGLRPIADALLDQRVVSGIGNVYRSEVLFLSGIHPDRPASALDHDELARIVETAVPLMRANTGPGAATGIVTRPGLRRTTRRAQPDEDLWVYGRRGRPCRKCGTPIESVKRGLDARSIYWCPKCQK
jgi:endonuclease-8